VSKCVYCAWRRNAVQIEQASLIAKATEWRSEIRVFVEIASIALLLFTPIYMPSAVAVSILHVP
jgi:hypothetical protein